MQQFLKAVITVLNISVIHTLADINIDCSSDGGSSIAVANSSGSIAMKQIRPNCLLKVTGFSPKTLIGLTSLQRSSCFYTALITVNGNYFCVGKSDGISDVYSSSNGSLIIKVIATLIESITIDYYHGKFS